MLQISAQSIRRRRSLGFSGEPSCKHDRRDVLGNATPLPSLRKGYPLLPPDGQSPRREIGSVKDLHDTGSMPGVITDRRISTSTDVASGIRKKIAGVFHCLRSFAPPGWRVRRYWLLTRDPLTSNAGVDQLPLSSQSRTHHGVTVTWALCRLSLQLLRIRVSRRTFGSVSPAG